MAIDVRNLYFRGNRIRNDTIAGFQALMTDVWFLYGIDQNARLQSQKSTGRTFFTTFVSFWSSHFVKRSCTLSTMNFFLI